MYRKFDVGKPETNRIEYKYFLITFLLWCSFRLEANSVTFCCKCVFSSVHMDYPWYGYMTRKAKPFRTSVESSMPVYYVDHVTMEWDFESIEWCTLFETYEVCFVIAFEKMNCVFVSFHSFPHCLLSSNCCNLLFSTQSFSNETSTRN